MQETVNQYVWIQVKDINSMVMCSSNTGESICNLVYNEETGVLKCQNVNHIATETNLVSRLYRMEKTNFTERNQEYEGVEIYEPGIVTGDGTQYDGDNINLEVAGMNKNSTSEDFFEQLKNDFYLMVTSVAKNGGFYISRYEVGKNGESKKGQIVLSAANIDNTDDNYLGGNMWYGLYNTIRNIDENKQMIWGCQYDQVIKFLVEQGEEAQTGHNNRNLTTSRALSGQNPLDKMRNIYDLEGNFWEWTMEANSNISRATRGGNCTYVNSNQFRSASVRGGVFPNNNSGNDVSTRATIYL